MGRHSDRDRVWNLMEKIGLCMLVTHDGSSDELHARPMHAHIARDEEAVFFLADIRQRKDDEIEINENVCLTFADPGSQAYVSVTGTANVLDDKAKVAELWSTAARAWWDSKDDPNIRVLRVMPSMAEFWDSPGTLVTSVKMAAAVLTGRRPALGDSRKVAL